MASKSTGEAMFLNQLKAYKMPEPEEEYRFHPVRRWRFDFAWPDQKVAVEIEGGVYNGGRHTRGKGFEGDCIKYNTAQLMGWTVLRFTTGQVKDGYAIDTMLEVKSDNNSI